VLSQLGLTASQVVDLNVKLSRVDVWGIATASSTDRPAVAIDCASFLPTVSTDGSKEFVYGILKRLTDQGNLSQAAKVSYSWPAHMADLPLSAKGDNPVCSVSGNVANVAVHLHLLWSSAGGEEVPL